MEKIRIAVAHRGAGLAPVFATLEGGYFREQGLDVELVDVHGHPRALEVLLNGGAEFLNSVGPEVILANLRHNGDAAIIASAISRSAQQISARPGLTTRDQLRGKRWGVTARSDADECSILMAFERWGWDIAKDAQIVVVGSNGPRLDLLLDPQKVDVAIMHAPEPFQAAKRGWNLVEDLGRMDVAFQNSCAVTTRRLLNDHPETAIRYVRAYCKGVYRFRTDAEFGLGVLRKYTQERDESVIANSWVLFARLMGGMMFPSLEGVRNAAGVLHRLGATPRLVNPSEVVAMAPMAAVDDEGYLATFVGRKP